MNCCFHLHVAFTRRLSKQQFSFGNRRALYGKEFSLFLSSLKRANTDLKTSIDAYHGAVLQPPRQRTIEQENVDISKDVEKMVL